VPASIPYPPSIPLARLPTPIEPLARVSARLGIALDVKRDDLTDVAMTGNKVRKLEFLLAAARAEGCEGAVTCGAAQSNHARATAVAAARLGMKAHLVLRGEAPASVEANLLLARLCGASARFVPLALWPRRDEVMREEAARLGGRWSVIPEGGSSALGAWGYVRCAEEIAAHERAAGIAYDAVVCADGSGGTHAGLLAGRLLLDRPWRVLGFAVCDDAAYFRGRVGAILDEMRARYALRIEGHGAAFENVDAYSASCEADLDTIRDLAAEEGIFLDPTYTAKALRGLLGEVAAGRIARGSRVLFVHTGGIFGLFPRAADFHLSAS
jgi:D-cysteine desulfhydrase